MKPFNVIASALIASIFAVHLTHAQKPASLGDNAALRYWAAFSQMQDSAISDQDAKELDAALDGMGPFNPNKFEDLIQKNKLALQIMARGTSLPRCDWGLDYGLGGDVPVDYARKALALGRLNVLYVMNLYHSGDKDGAIDALAAGVRFSHDVGNGGSFFATLVAKELLVTHLMAVSDGMRMGQLSASQKARLQSAVASLGDGLDWGEAAKRDLAALGSNYSKDPQASAAVGQIASSYAVFLNDESKLPALTDAINHAPADIARLIPNPTRVLEQKQELTKRLQEARALLQGQAQP